MKKLFKLLLIVVGFSLAALAQTNMAKAKTSSFKLYPHPYQGHCEWAFRLCRYDYQQGLVSGNWKEAPGN